MPYEKIPEVTTPGSEAPAKVRFYYVTDDVFNLVSQLSSNKAASVKKTDGNPLFEELVVSQDNILPFKRFLKMGVYLSFDILFQIIQGDTDPIFFDKEITLVGGSTVTASGAEILDNDNYRTVTLTQIDQFYFQALTDYVLSEWYWYKGLSEAGTYHKTRFNEMLIYINTRSQQLRPKV
jgi:hypothetical protein